MCCGLNLKIYLDSEKTKLCDIILDPQIYSENSIFCIIMNFYSSERLCPTMYRTALCPIIPFLDEK